MYSTLISNNIKNINKIFLYIILPLTNIINPPTHFAGQHLVYKILCYKRIPHFKFYFFNEKMLLKVKTDSTNCSLFLENATK